MEHVVSYHILFLTDMFAEPCETRTYGTDPFKQSCANVCTKQLTYAMYICCWSHSDSYSVITVRKRTHKFTKKMDRRPPHYSDVIMSMIASQITGILLVSSTVCTCEDHRKHQSSGDRWIPLTKGQKRGKCLPFGDVITPTSPDSPDNYQ